MLLKEKKIFIKIWSHARLAQFPLGSLSYFKYIDCMWLWLPNCISVNNVHFQEKNARICITMANFH